MNSGNSPEPSALSAEQLKILQHALGMDEYGRSGRGERNHFVTGPGSTDFASCVQLVDQGYMTRRSGSALYGGDDIFHATDVGRLAAQTCSPNPPRLTRSQKRYRAFLDHGSDLPFGQWLKHYWNAAA